MKRIIIYTRYSSVLQQEDSLEAQEEKCRQALQQAGIDPGPAQVLSDMIIRDRP